MGLGHGLGAMEFARHPPGSFARLPPDDRRPSGKEQPLDPGKLRTQQVSVGRHAAPDAVKLPDFVERWSRFYGGAPLGERRVLAAAASHQRLAWIHPFRDGNGRVARLHTHLVLAQLGMTNGTWSVTRGLRAARTRTAPTWQRPTKPVPAISTAAAAAQNAA